MKKISIATLALGMFAALALTACDDTIQPTSDQSQRHAQEQLNQQSNSEVGMPAITNFQEKRMAKMILELRDKKISTITYTQDMNGHLHKLCDSVGFGLPYATEYTNPQRIAHNSETPSTGNITLPQADPNGLFSPPSAEGTWVLCLDKKSKDVSPIYVEPRIIVSPFPLQQ